MAGVMSKRFPSTGIPGGRGIGVDILMIVVSEGQTKLKRRGLEQQLKRCRLRHYTSSLLTTSIHPFHLNVAIIPVTQLFPKPLELFLPLVPLFDPPLRKL